MHCAHIAVKSEKAKAPERTACFQEENEGQTKCERIDHLNNQPTLPRSLDFRPLELFCFEIPGQRATSPGPLAVVIRRSGVCGQARIWGDIRHLQAEPIMLSF